MLLRPTLRFWTLSPSIAPYTTRGAAATSTKPLKKTTAEQAKPRGGYQLQWRPLISIRGGTFYRDYPVLSDGVGSANLPLFTKIDFDLPSRLPEFPEIPPPNCSNRARTRYEKALRREQAKQEEEGPFHWAVIGTDCTEFLGVLQGRYVAVPARSRQYPYLNSRKFSPKDPSKRIPNNAIAYVGFSGEGSNATGGTRGAYLSARYESLREETDWTVRQYLKGETELNPLHVESKAKGDDEAQFEKVVADFRLQELLDLPMSSLSNGQTRRTRIAKALLFSPELLLLDEPFMGLDPATTENISSILRDVAYRASPRVMISLRPQDSIPEWITHILILDNHQIVFSDTKKEFIKQAKKASGVSEGTASKARMQLRSLFAPGGLFELQRHRYMDGEKKDRTARISNSHEGISDAKALTEISQDGKPVVEMEGVHVRYGDKVVLGNWKQLVRGRKRNKIGLWWRVRQGQRWAVLGANGSGKTTLLSLITSDHPQAYAQPVRLFGRSRLPEPGVPGISIFDLQARMGHSSPEIHAFFPRQLSIRASIESAWADTFLAKPELTYERDTVVDAVLEYFQPELDNSVIITKGTKGQKANSQEDECIDMSFIPEVFRVDMDDAAASLNQAASSRSSADYRPQTKLDYAENTTFGQLSVAQQRLVLFIRAIIKKPDLVILDEAFSGMSANMREKCFYLLNNSGPPSAEIDQNLVVMPLPYLGPTQALIVVSHLPEEIPDTVRFWMRLPSEMGEGRNLDFVQGVLLDKSTLSTDLKAWETIWSENSLSKAMFMYGRDSEGKLSDGERYRYVIPRRTRIIKRDQDHLETVPGQKETSQKEEACQEEAYQDEEDEFDEAEDMESERI